ncbi:spermidine synthase [Neoactinobaculum massilliense]|uniref:spermidine synthase n=1 Tax=Neoactinobaculum massilliense TaxID=2364794 RepID=UPI000F535DA4|nr:fused MFS/spermidine synthase [Neoactinobaculum massilliense]
MFSTSATYHTDFSVAQLVRYPDRPSLVTLLLDGVESSALDLDDPAFLEFEYMQQMAAAIELAFPGGIPLRALHLGAAGCALPRAINALHPGSRQLACELDSKLARYVRDWFDLPRSPALRIRVEDGRQALDTTQATWDIVVRDAFLDADVPAPLRTVECAQRAATVLSARGLYLLNSVASAGLDRLGQECAALLTAFEHVCAIADPAVMHGRRWGNIVLIASTAPLPDGLDRAIRRLPMPTRVVGEADIRRRAQGSSPLHDTAAGWL